MVYTWSTADPALKMIVTQHSYNTADASSGKECAKERANKTVHDEGGDYIALHQISMFQFSHTLANNSGEQQWWKILH